MALESFGFIKDLVDTNPAGTDPKSQGDDHLRGIKETLKNQFPGFTDGIGITLTEEELNKYKVPWVGEDYTDPDAIGTNPTAEIYPDGTIVGSTGNGRYVKRPDGSLEMTGTGAEQDSTSATGGIFQTTDTSSWTYPIVNVTGTVWGSCSPLGNQRWSAVNASGSTMSYRQLSSVSSVSTVGSILKATGKWK